jgi:hypothetical protein
MSTETVVSIASPHLAKLPDQPGIPIATRRMARPPIIQRLNSAITLLLRAEGAKFRSAGARSRFSRR